MLRRDFLRGMGAVALSSGLFGASEASGQGSSELRIAFGSCADQSKPQPVWDVIASKNPDMFVFLGDNVYADTFDMEDMARQYERLGLIPEFKRFRQKVPIVATWDDHDYGQNDIGREYPKRFESKNIMLNFFGEPKNSPRRTREGVYASYFVEHPSRRVQVILLDLRWFRSKLYQDANGHFAPNPDPEAELLGAEQWKWLEEQLAQPVDYRILGSSIQFLSGEHRWEKWSNFPYEQRRLIHLLEKMRIDNLTIISGDMHYGEISREVLAHGFELIDLTSSGLNRFEPATGYDNSRRLGLFDSGDNFGMITLTWFSNEDRPHVRREVFDLNGVARICY